MTRKELVLILYDQIQTANGFLSQAALFTSNENI